MYSPASEIKYGEAVWRSSRIREACSCFSTLLSASIATCVIRMIKLPPRSIRLLLHSSKAWRNVAMCPRYRTKPSTPSWINWVWRLHRLLAGGNLKSGNKFVCCPLCMMWMSSSLRKKAKDFGKYLSRKKKSLKISEFLMLLAAFTFWRKNSYTSSCVRNLKSNFKTQERREWGQSCDNCPLKWRIAPWCASEADSVFGAAWRGTFDITGKRRFRWRLWLLAESQRYSTSNQRKQCFHFDTPNAALCNDSTYSHRRRLLPVGAVAWHNPNN